jgi:hypothetical protein
MNDTNAVDTVRDSLTTARDSLTGVHMTTPLDTIVRHGRARRRRHRLTGLAGATAVAACAVLAATALPSASHPASHQPHTQLAAWTVVKQPSGNIFVTIRELHNPAGLQATLRADGVPATVTFLGQLNPACYPWPGAGLRGPHTPAGDTLFNNVFPTAPPGAPAGVIVIRPSALPSGGGVQLAAAFAHAEPGAGITIGAGLVQTSPQCTGS